MKFYDYVCTECKKITEYIAESLKDPLPKKIKCQYCGKDCIYDWKQTKQSAVHVPEHMKAGHEGFKYNKINREHKKYF